MFKKDYQRTHQEKAQRAKMSIFARMAGCAYLAYVIVQMLKTPREEMPGTSWPIIVAIVLIVLAAGVVALTVWDLIRRLKMGIFKAETYEAQTGESFPRPDPDASEDGMYEALSDAGETSGGEPREDNGSDGAGDNANPRGGDTDE
jgi:hypothetical protein